MDLIFTYIYFYLPGAMANIGANIGRFIPGFREMTMPVDIGMKLNGIRLIGDHKNVGSFIFGVLFGTNIGIFKTIYLDQFFSGSLLLQLSVAQNIFMYTLISLGALTGDLIKSIIKRQLKRPEHTMWIPFDEIDHTTASLLLAKIFFPIAWMDILGIIVIIFFLHLATNVLGYQIKVKEVPY